MEKPRLIERAFPLKQASLDSVHEKNVRHGHISTLHIWPARRPLAACRAALIATLLPDPGDPEERRRLIERIGGRVVPKIEKKKVNGQAGRGRARGDRRRHPPLGTRVEPRPAILPRRNPQGLRRARAARARSVRRRRRDPARSDAPWMRSHRDRYQPGRLVHPQMHARISAEARRPEAPTARFRASRPRVHGGLLQGAGLQGRDAPDATRATGPDIRTPLAVRRGRRPRDG